MKITSAFAVCGGLLLGVNATLNAQAVATPSAATAQVATPKDVGPPDAWSAKPTGAYRVVMYDADPSGPMPVDLTLTEVDGKLSANFWVVGDHDGLPMSAAVKDKELVLNADTPRGALEVRIEHRGPKLTGKWQLGYKMGKLDGNAKS